MVRRIGDERVVVASPSLIGEILLSCQRRGRPGVARTGRLRLCDGPRSKRLRVLERTVDFDGASEFAAVAGTGELEATSVFRWRAIAVLALVGLGSIASALLFRVRRFRRQLKGGCAGRWRVSLR